MPTELLTVTAIASLGIISPGPGFAVAFRNSISYGRNVGLGTAFGIACGDLVHVLVNLLGIAALLICYPKIAFMLHVCGGLYLLYLGAKRLFSKGFDVSAEKAQTVRSGISGFVEGLLITILNPKALLFWLGLFSVIIPPTMSMLMRLALGGWIFVLSSSWFVLVALCVTQKAFNQFFITHMQRIERVISVVLIAIALKVLIVTDARILKNMLGDHILGKPGFVLNQTYSFVGNQ
jgi:threonine/homoserine/homoserine lactone efflux protein